MRDHTLLLLGFAGAFRRSELVGLNIEDVAEVEEGLQVLAKRSKTDQEGEGELHTVDRGDLPGPKLQGLAAGIRHYRGIHLPASGPPWLAATRSAHRSFRG